jgi:hypothetical protein
MKYFLHILFCLAPFLIAAQDYSAQAKIYFSKYQNSRAFIELCSKSLPTVDECKLVFKGQNAYTYFGYIEEVRTNISEQINKESENFADIRIDTFNSNDIQDNKGNYAGGMRRLKDILQGYITFYEVNLLRTKDAEFGVAYKYWLNINGRWVFFPKPWNAFDKE